jgi:DNA-binding NarL/FixJ family response regulator
MIVLVVDDHVIVREGVLRLLTATLDAPQLKQASGRDAIALFQASRPDLVILDLNLDGVSGLEILKRLRLEDPKAKVLVFSMHTEPIYAARALAMGARGYVSKSAPAEELVTAVRNVLGERRHVEANIAAQLTVDPPGDGDPLRLLTNREVDIMRLLGEGKSLTGIAAALGVSYKTVANTCGIIKEKLMCERTADLVRLAVELRRS